MSAIRPPVQSPLFPTQQTPSPARAARSDFFRAALDGVRPPAATTLPVEVKTETKVASAAPLPFEPSGDRPVRPGSLLDIRI